MNLLLGMVIGGVGASGFLYGVSGVMGVSCLEMWEGVTVMVCGLAAMVYGEVVAG